MTLLLALANDKHAFLIADRRVTRNGEILSEEHNKICVLFCNDAKLAVAFTGLATLNGFETARWITSTLAAIGKTTGDILSILAELQQHAEQIFRELDSPSPNLTMVFSGFVYWSDRPEPRVYVVSNTELETGAYPRGEFSIFTFSAGEPVVQAAGMTTAFPEATRSALVRLLGMSDLPPQSLLRFAVQHMRAASIDWRSGGVIGGQFNAASMQAATDTPVVCTYHSAKSSTFAYGPNVVATSAFSLYGYEISAGSFLSGSDIRKKDACWCGSGNQFRHCHLRKFGAIYVNMPQFKRPLFPTFGGEIDPVRPSGRIFRVIGSFE